MLYHIVQNGEILGHAESLSEARRARNTCIYGGLGILGVIAIVRVA